jgi:hypothetical protein
MKNIERKRDRYLKDPLPKRLGGLAASLGRVASSPLYPPATLRLFAIRQYIQNNPARWTEDENNSLRAA